MKKNKTTKLVVPMKKTAPLQGLVHKSTYQNKAYKKKVLNNGLFYKFPVSRKKHSINVFSPSQKTRQASASQSFYREAGRKVKQISPHSFSTRGAEANASVFVCIRSGTNKVGASAVRCTLLLREDNGETSKPNNKGVTSSLAGYKLYFAKKLWYYDKRAPIPGGNAKLSTGFMRKNKFYKKIFASYVVFKKYLGFNKKAINKLYRNTSLRRVGPSAALKRPAVGSPLNHRLLMHMDSLFHSTMRKSGLMLNPYQNKIRQSYTLNGKAVRKKNFVLKHANKAFLKDRDFCL